MKKQKICIIGGGLTGLITALSLSKLNLDIDLFVGNTNKNLGSIRTTAISHSNYLFLKKLDFFKISKNEFWPCKKIKLYSKQQDETMNEIFEFSEKKNIFYMMKNSNIIEKIIKSIKKSKAITLKNNINVSQIINSGSLKKVRFNGNESSKYNLVIICAGGENNLVKDAFNDQVVKHNYNETSVTTILKHKKISNNIARQFFFNDEILAFLPISNRETSIVWHIKKKYFSKYISKNNVFLKKKIQSYTNKYLGKIKFSKKIEFKNLNLLIRKKYFKNRILLFGDVIHAVHPLAGQGFNMTIRDLISLEKILKNKIDLGLDIGSSDILMEFSNENRPKNLVYSLGIDLVKNLFSKDNQSVKNLRNTILKKLNNNSLAKNLFSNLADKGLRL